RAARPDDRPCRPARRGRCVRELAQPRAVRADLRPAHLRAARGADRGARRQLLRLSCRDGHGLCDVRLDGRRRPARSAALAQANLRVIPRSSNSSITWWATQLTSQTITTTPTYVQK